MTHQKWLAFEVSEGQVHKSQKKNTPKTQVTCTEHVQVFIALFSKLIYIYIYKTITYIIFVLSRLLYGTTDDLKNARFGYANIQIQYNCLFS